MPEEIKKDPEKKSSRFKKSTVILSAVFLLLVGGIYFWQSWLSPEAWNKLKYDLFMKYYVGPYEKAMREDVYGGKTPEETLQMFIEALKKNDVELASKYFALETNEKSQDYLTRRKWEEGLKNMKEKNGLDEMIIKIQNTTSTGYTWDKKGMSYESLGEDGLIDVLIEFGLNEYSGVWKIESM